MISARKGDTVFPLHALDAAHHQRVVPTPPAADRHRQVVHLDQRIAQGDTGPGLVGAIVGLLPLQPVAGDLSDRERPDPAETEGRVPGHGEQRLDEDRQRQVHAAAHHLVARRRVRTAPAGRARCACRRPGAIWAGSPARAASRCRALPGAPGRAGGRERARAAPAAPARCRAAACRGLSAADGAAMPAPARSGGAAPVSPPLSNGGEGRQARLLSWGTSGASSRSAMHRRLRSILGTMPSSGPLYSPAER